MSDMLQAKILIDHCRHRLSGPELCVCEMIAAGHTYPHEAEEAHTFRRLCIEHSRQLAEAAELSPVPLP